MLTFFPVVYSAPALTYQQQIDFFTNHGLSIINSDDLKETLSRISFFRLKEYGVPFISKATNQYIRNTNESHIISLYIFDHSLRMTVFEAIKVIEIALRAKIANHFSIKYGPIGYQDFSNFNAKKEKYSQVYDSIVDEIECRKEPIIRKFYETHGDTILPLWMAFEFVPFGIISQFFGILKAEDRKSISNEFSVDSQKVMSNWIHTINHIRNLCAHHARLWNNTLDIKPKTLKTKNGLSYFPNSLDDQKDKIFYSLTIILFLLDSIKSPIAKRYKINIRNLLLKSPIKNQLNGFEIPMGIMVNWENIFPWALQNSH